MEAAAAVSEHRAARGRRDEFAERRDAVLQRHLTRRASCAVACAPAEWRREGRTRERCLRAPPQAPGLPLLRSGRRVSGWPSACEPCAPPSVKDGRADARHQSVLRGFGGGGSLPTGWVEAGGSEAGKVSSTSWSSAACSGFCEACAGRLTGPSGSPPRRFTWALSMCASWLNRQKNACSRLKFPPGGTRYRLSRYGTARNVGASSDCRTKPEARAALTRIGRPTSIVVATAGFGSRS